MTFFFWPQIVLKLVSELCNNISAEYFGKMVEPALPEFAKLLNKSTEDLAGFEYFFHFIVIKTNNG